MHIYQSRRGTDILESYSYISCVDTSSRHFSYHRMARWSMWHTRPFLPHCVEHRSCDRHSCRTNVFCSHQRIIYSPDALRKTRQLIIPAFCGDFVFIHEAGISPPRVVLIIILNAYVQKNILPTQLLSFYTCPHHIRVVTYFSLSK